MNKIKVNKLTKIFGNQHKKALNLLRSGKSKQEILDATGMTVGVNEVSFSVESGEVFVIMGLSGSGKSTLIRLINRLIEPTAGEVFIDGENIIDMDTNTLTETRRQKLGMVFQNFGLLPHRSVLSNVAYGLELQGVSKKERENLAHKTIEEVGLKGYENSYPDELSGGMQQRVGIARALTNDADILLMDEAFSALDPIIRKEMQDDLLKVQNRLGKTILFITHDLDEALKLGDRIAIMKDGEIVQIGTPEEIINHPVNAYVASFVQDINRTKVLKASHVMKDQEITVTKNEDLQNIIKKMNDSEMSTVFITDEQGKLEGLLTIENAIEAYQNNTSLHTRLLKEINTTTPNTSLNDLIGIAAKTNHPIAVVKEGKLQGTVSRVSILSSLVLENDKKERIR